jgi:hypothetical protein
MPNMIMMVFLVVTVCRIISLFRCSGGMCCLHLHEDWIWFRWMLTLQEEMCHLCKDSVTLKIGSAVLSELSGWTYPAYCNNPDDHYLRNACCESLKTYTTCCAHYPILKVLYKIWQMRLILHRKVLMIVCCILYIVTNPFSGCCHV